MNTGYLCVLQIFWSGQLIAPACYSSIVKTFYTKQPLIFCLWSMYVYRHCFYSLHALVSSTALWSFTVYLPSHSYQACAHNKNNLGNKFSFNGQRLHRVRFNVTISKTASSHAEIHISGGLDKVWGVAGCAMCSDDWSLCLKTLSAWKLWWFNLSVTPRVQLAHWCHKAWGLIYQDFWTPAANSWHFKT